jgi:uncharacterized membrane protein YphA (DoxX/SURF4 family)
MTLNNRLNSSWWALRIGIGLAAFLAGLDKLFDILTNWGMYLSSFSERMLPVDANTFMHLVGIIEMIVGLAILTRWTNRWLHCVLLAAADRNQFADFRRIL